MDYTQYFNLGKPAQDEIYDVEVPNNNMEIIDEELHKTPVAVNGILPDPTTREINVTEVPLAGNLSSDVAQVVVGTFTERTSGGGASIESGFAFLTSVKGNSVHTGIVPESIEWTLSETSGITATFDRDTFVAYVPSSGTITIAYTSSWSADPALYGFTITGTPAAGDEITVVYVKENRGTITTATPTTFNSTGWNLYNSATGYAKVVRYSDEYGYRIGGAYSIAEFAETVTGTRTAISMEDGIFNVPSDGYVFVTGANATTYIYPTWSDWTDEYVGNFQTYTVDTIDLSEIMLAFPNGLLNVGAVRDEINLNTQTTIQRVQRLAYTAENIADVIESGLPYDADTNYIYVALETPVVSNISIDGTYTVSDHGIEFVNGTSVPVMIETLYGENLKDKLRTDVLTISAQELSATQKAQVLDNIGAASATALTNAVTILNASIASATAFSTATPSVQTSKVTDRGSSAIKIGNVVIVNIECEVAESVSNTTTLYSIPSGFRPSATVGSFYAVGKTATGDISPRNGSSYFTINSSGNVIQRWSSTYSGWFAAVFIYSI